MYLARDLELGIFRAVKELPASSRREAGLLRLLEHPYLPKMIDYAERGNFCYIIMEYIHGRSLEEYMQEGYVFSIEEILRIGDVTLQVLEYFHSRKPAVFYGDLKPANIMMTDQKRLYLVDFGSAVFSYSVSYQETKGTRGYAAPEQLHGKISAASDFYALGKTMEVNAVQVNFADHKFNVHAPHAPVVYQYYIEGSTNGKDWTRLVDEEKNLQDAPHKLHTLRVPAKVQYLRICNTKDMEGSFSLFDLRVFGQGSGKVPAGVTGFQASRDNNDKRIYRFRWNPQEEVTGYILRWGTQKEKLTHSMVVYGNQYEARYFNRDSEYYFSISAFNENGVGK